MRLFWYISILTPLGLLHVCTSPAGIRGEDLACCGAGPPYVAQVLFNVQYVGHLMFGVFSRDVSRGVSPSQRFPFSYII